MTLQEVKSLVEKERFDEAFAECETLLSEGTFQKSDILRTRAYAFAMHGNYENAVRDYQIVIEDGGMMQDYYLAAFDSLYIEQFTKASEWFLELLRLGEEQNEQWFECASYFYLSYAHMELGNYNDANDYLDKAVEVSSDVSMPIPRAGMCSHIQLRQEIELRVQKIG